MELVGLKMRGGDGMKVSTRGRYGLRAMADLAMVSHEDKCISLKSIAERQGISEHYLEQLILPLKKAGIVTSMRGAQGGYKLARAAADISVGEILRALEGSLAPVDCIAEEGDGSCGNANCETCTTKQVWGQIYDSLNHVVDSISLGDLAKNAAQMD